MMLFKPDTLYGSRRNFEEFFTGVVLRALHRSGLDHEPALAGRPRSTASAAGGSMPGRHRPASRRCLQYTVEGDAKPRTLLTVEGQRQARHAERPPSAPSTVSAA